MEEKRFDELTTGLVAEGAARRGLLGLAAGALAVALGHLSGRGAAGQQAEGLCERCPKICETRHLVTCARVRRNQLCVCANTADGGTACVDLSDEGVQCSAKDECKGDNGCRPSEVCISVRGKHCCDAGERGNLCAPRCDA